MHVEPRLCAQHRAAACLLPCGRRECRRKGGGLPNSKRLQLHETEAAAGQELRAHLKLLLGYLRQRSAKDAQHKALAALLEAPPHGTAVLLSDWKELETLPQCWKQTGDQFFAQARHEVSVWGALLVEHSDVSTAEKPDILQTYFVIVSKILDHAALRANQLIRIALGKKLQAVEEDSPGQ